MAKKGKAPEGPFAGLRDLRNKLAEEEEKKKTAPRTSASKGSPAPKPPARERRKAESEGSKAADAQEDALAFHRLVSGVTPLDQRRGRVARAEHGRDENPRPRRDPQEAIRQETDEVHEHLRVLIEGGSRFEVSDDGRHVEGRRVDVPPDWLRRIRRGLVPIDARLDLHGLRAAEAQSALETFLRATRGRGERCVLVVHGKGEHSPGGLGVLRGEMAAWLSQGSSSTHVAAFASAREEDGGAGAVYILLRR